MSSSDSDSDTQVNTKPNVAADNDSDSAPSHRSESQTSRRSESPPSHQSPAHRQEAGDSDSERSHASPVPKPSNRRLIDSDEEQDDDDDVVVKKPQSSQLFGDEVSSDSDDERGDAAKAANSDGEKSDGEKSDDSNQSLRGIVLHPEMDEEEPDVPAPPEFIDLDITKNPINLKDPIHCKFPNFLSVETKPFDIEHFEDNEDDDIVDAEGRSRLKLKVENTIRWRARTDEDGNEIRESNAKVVKWSDGTASLYLGQEIFDVQIMPMVGNTHLSVNSRNMLCGIGIFDKKMQFRPHSTDSKTHRKVTLNMADRTRKSGQVKMLTEVGKNPDDAKREAVRKEEEQFRAALRREAQQRYTRTRERTRGLTSGFLEDGDSDDGSPRRGRKPGEAPLIGNSSDESDTERIEKAKDDESDSDEEYQKSKQQKKKIVSSDEDEEGDDKSNKSESD